MSDTTHLPGNVTGKDGKSYPASRRAAPEPNTPTVPLPPAPPSTYEWVDTRLTELRQQQNRSLADFTEQQNRILAAYTELDTAAPRLTAAERRTVRDRLVDVRRGVDAVRRRIDAKVVDFGGRHAALPQEPGPFDAATRSNEGRNGGHARAGHEHTQEIGQ